MTEQIRISAKNLGALALPDCCPRCFYLRLRMEQKLPYQIFPGIFSSIDALTKRIIHGYFDEHAAPPPWLKDLGELVDYVEPPHYSRFNMIDERHGIRLTGAADGIFRRPDRSYLIVDYKTAKFTGTQDALFPMYEAQLLVYALIGERCGFAPVSALALIYFEPVTDTRAVQARNFRKDGFAMGFTPHILHVAVDTSKVDRLLSQTRKIFDLPAPPPARPGCRNCQQLKKLFGLCKG